MAPVCASCGRPGYDVADGVDAGLFGLHPLVDLDKPALRLDLRFLEADVLRARRAAHSHQHLLGFFLDLLAVGGREGHLRAGLRLLDLLDLRAHVDVDAALLEGPRQLLADLFVFVGHHARQELDDGDLRAEAAEDRAELHAHGACADDRQRLRNLLQRENLDIGQDRYRPRSCRAASSRRSRSRESRSSPGRCSRLCRLRLRWCVRRPSPAR